MQQIAQFMTDSSDTERFKAGRNFTSEDYEKIQCEWYNGTIGNLGYYDCPECKNKGYRAILSPDGFMMKVKCSCMKIRESMENLENSGLKNMAERYTFDRFSTSQEWQKNAKARVMDYAENGGNKWLFVAGQSGSGKTHLCTAVCTYLISKGCELRYVMWRDVFHELEGLKYKTEAYQARLKELQNIEVLYIDDFLKSKDKRQLDNELNYAYEIINSRYVSAKKTIISTELHSTDIIALDKALGGRIVENSAGYMIQIKNEPDRNYRLRG